LATPTREQPNVPVSIQDAVGDQRRSALAKYQDVVVGSRSLGRLILHELVITLTSWIPGALGLVLRRITYPWLLGEVGKGFSNFLKTLDAGRIGIGALSLGIAEGAFNECLKYTAERKQFSRPIASFQGVHFALADMATGIEAARHLVYHAAWKYQNGEEIRKEAAMAKLFASELAMRVTIKAVQLHGGYGYTTEYPVERMMRDAKVGEIGEGTSEILRIVIARCLLGDVIRAY
jgi:alkylation response protein AidB-like acyl-CoA dehydrogenase